ncbi:hypothetical protein M0805_008458 [Coniferiporia weirii]|nr:hypothetical protein M0805_008458 [Coniferiporia weirii]
MRVILTARLKLIPLDVSQSMGTLPRVAVRSDESAFLLWYIVGSFACIGGGLVGLDILSMSGVLNPGSNVQGAIVVATVPAGSFVGSLAVSLPADRFGRKMAIILSGFVWIIGSILQCAAQVGFVSLESSPSAQFCCLAIGLVSTTVPIYQAEITKPSVRGSMIALQQWSITWDISVQYFVQFGCSYVNGDASFRIPWDEALQILTDLHGKGDPENELVQVEFAEIKQQVYFERTEGAKSYFDLVKPGVFRRVGLGTSLRMWSQLSGILIMMYYVVYVFQGAGLTGRRGNLVADSVDYVLNVVFTSTLLLFSSAIPFNPILILNTPMHPVSAILYIDK